MLRSRSIPIYNHPEDWHTFLYKASKGSIEAVDTLDYANKAYMVAFTGDPSCPATMHLDDYNAMVREQFPLECPAASIQQLHDIAYEAGWIASRFCVSETPHNKATAYIALWGRQPVDESALMNDAMLHCLDRWSADHFIECVHYHGADYDSRVVTAAMLYLSLTWPDT